MHRNDKPLRSSLVRGLAFALLPLGLAALASGCPGELEDPDRFIDGGFTCPDVPNELFKNSCGGAKICHEGAEPAAGLDLVSPGVEERLIDKKGRDCPGILVDPVLPESSLIYTKLSPSTSCGSPMPLGRPAFTAAELECVRNWIAKQTPTAPAEDAGDSMDAGDITDAAGD